ncbi:hypothetical protein PR202_ga14868 [Eleusine coracana subsp. coracana]|uniref:Uncharacterized protein n=1 Tax=Eleusine coracana subsp. coracana TaxID=191504 RepID=A0AAV5CIP3_ELECO|nr:hypothetical protein PR202_ga14868 [Eleusine coracana subsp. coracana]
MGDSPSSRVYARHGAWMTKRALGWRSDTGGFDKDWRHELRGSRPRRPCQDLCARQQMTHETRGRGKATTLFWLLASPARSGKRVVASLLVVVASITRTTILVAWLPKNGVTGAGAPAPASSLLYRSHTMTCIHRHREQGLMLNVPEHSTEDSDNVVVLSTEAEIIRRVPNAPEKDKSHVWPHIGGRWLGRGTLQGEETPHHTQMQAPLLYPAPSRPPLPTLWQRLLPPVVASASAQRASAPCRAAAFGGTTSYAAAARSSLPRLAATAEESPASGPSDPTPLSAEDETERARLAQVSKKLEKTAQYFKNLGSVGFWSQLVCTIVSAGILSFSAVATGKATASFTLCATAVGIVAAFISVFRSFGYIRLSERLRRTAKEPSKATVGALVAKALTTSSVPYYQGIPPGQSPVLALDIFLVQASANTILSHFLGLSSSLELLRSVTLPQADVAPIPKPA